MGRGKGAEQGVLVGHAKTWCLEGVAVCQGDSSGTADPWGDSGPAVEGHLPLVPMRSPIGKLCMQNALQKCRVCGSAMPRGAEAAQYWDTWDDAQVAVSQLCPGVGALVPCPPNQGTAVPKSHPSRCSGFCASKLPWDRETPAPGGSAGRAPWDSCHADPVGKGHWEGVLSPV